jgi:hypothetical protein
METEANDFGYNAIPVDGPILEIIGRDELLIWLVKRATIGYLESISGLSFVLA